MKAYKWITSLKEWGKYEKHIFDTDYFILKIEDEVDMHGYEELCEDDIRRFADECELFYYASYGKEYPKKIDGEWVIVNEDEEWSNEMRKDFEEWISQSFS
tara:strand:- start:615 stop:917 length:303 start_codon:yes stop_codon:yes gene_type:complete